MPKKSTFIIKKNKMNEKNWKAFRNVTKIVAYYVNSLLVRTTNIIYEERK